MYCSENVLFWIDHNAFSAIVKKQGKLCGKFNAIWYLIIFLISQFCIEYCICIELNSQVSGRQ